MYHKPSNNAPGIIIETHKTPFSGSIKRGTKWNMKQIWILTYSLDFALSNNYLQVTIKFLESKVFNVKVEGFCIIKKRIKLQLSL